MKVTNHKRLGVSALLVAMALFAAQPAAAADTLKLTGFEFGSASVNLATNAPLAPAFVSSASVGAYNTKVNNGPTIESFCIDIWQALSFNTDYTIGTTYTYMPSMVGYTPHAGAPVITPAVVGNLNRLYDEATTLGYNTATKSAALQLAIWEIAFETPSNYDLGSGNFYSSGTSAAKTQAATWLAGLPAIQTPIIWSMATSARRSRMSLFLHQFPNPKPML